MMQKLEGDFAGAFNRRKHRSGSFWEDRYHCTMVEDGSHLWNRIEYVDLDMVHAGGVSHPCDWTWRGYHELVREKTRYRLLDLLAVTGPAQFVEEYRARIDQAIAAKKLKRQECWTERIAVGSQVYVRNIATAVRRECITPRIEEGENGSLSVG